MLLSVFRGLSLADGAALQVLPSHEVLWRRRRAWLSAEAVTSGSAWQRPTAAMSMTREQCRNSTQSSAFSSKEIGENTFWGTSGRTVQCVPSPVKSELAGRDPSVLVSLSSVVGHQSGVRRHPPMGCVGFFLVCHHVKVCNVQGHGCQIVSVCAEGVRDINGRTVTFF